MICFAGNLSRMLTASSDDVEGLSQKDKPLALYSTEQPKGWIGVTAGIRAAKLAIEDKDLNRAEAYLEEVLEFVPAESEAWHILAAIINRKGDKERARECLKRVVKLKMTRFSPDDALPVTKRVAKLLWAQHDRAGALDMLAELLLKTPDDPILIELQQQWTAQL